MHDTAKLLGEKFFNLYGFPGAKILDFGSADVNGTLRPYAPVRSEYTGVDMAEGAGVDVVITDSTDLPFEANTFDLIVSSSVFEHDPCFWMTFLELSRILKPTGVMYLNAPSNGKFHQHPLDCWRFYPDAVYALQKWANANGLNLQIFESFIHAQGPEGWRDWVAVFGGSHAARPLQTIRQSVETVIPG